MADDKIVLWFDIDNTLYPKSARIGELMRQVSTIDAHSCYITEQIFQRIHGMTYPSNNPYDHEVMYHASILSRHGLR